MKNFFFFLIVFHIFGYSANAMIIEQKTHLTNEVTLSWLSKMLGQEIIAKIKKNNRLDSFLQAWNQWAAPSVLLLIADKGLISQQQILIRLVEKVLNLAKNDPFTEDIFTEATQEIHEKTNSISPQNIDPMIVEARNDNIWHKGVLLKLIEENFTQTPDEIAFYEEMHNVLKNGQLIVGILKSKYRYVGRIRHFGKGPFMVVNFLYKISTNEIVATENEIATQPESIMFCIAEILRNDFFVRNIKHESKKDIATKNPLYIAKGRFAGFKDYFDEEYDGIRDQVWSDLKKYMTYHQVQYSDKEMKGMIEKIEKAESNSERQPLISKHCDNTQNGNVDYSILINHYVMHLYSDKIAKELIKLKLFPVVSLVDSHQPDKGLRINSLGRWKNKNN